MSKIEQILIAQRNYRVNQDVDSYLEDMTVILESEEQSLQYIF